NSTASAITGSPWHSLWPRFARMANASSRARKPRRCRSQSSGSSWTKCEDDRVESDGLLNIAAHHLGQLVGLGHGLADPGEVHFGSQRFELAANVLIADLASAFAQYQQVAKQLVEDLQMELELLALGSAYDFTYGHPRAEWCRTGRHFHQGEHGGAPF